VRLQTQSGNARHHTDVESKTSAAGEYRTVLEVHGVELTATRRYADRWMMLASYAFNTAVDYYSSPNGDEDPTNIDKWNGAQFAQETSGSGIDNVFVNAKHLFKAAGVYVAPWDINLGAFYNVRQGYLFPQRVLSPPRTGAAGTAWLYYDAWGESRYDTLQTIDMRVSKRFAFGRRNVEASFDVFNLGNVNTVLTRNLNQTAPNANFVTGIVAPRVARIGVRVVF